MNPKGYSLAFSPCPNDTFMFDGLVNQGLNGLVDLQYDFLDIEKLNEAALDAKYDYTKLSFGVFPKVAKDYEITDSGCALGHACGPLLITKPGYDPEALKQLPVAIPGLHTTANLLMSILFPEFKNKKVYVFSEIEDAVLKGEVAAGLIIHENRFTYQSKGLVKVFDIGDVWEKRTGLPVPLGCIAIRRSLPAEEKLFLQQKLKESIELAFKDPAKSASFVAAHSQEMSPEVQRQHIDLYVNNFSVSLGEKGKEAIRYLFAKGAEAGLLPVVEDSLFLNDSSTKA